MMSENSRAGTQASLIFSSFWPAYEECTIIDGVRAARLPADEKIVIFVRVHNAQLVVCAAEVERIFVATEADMAACRGTGIAVKLRVAAGHEVVPQNIESDMPT